MALNAKKVQDTFRAKKIRTRVVVLMGGKSPEYEISVISGIEVVKNIPEKYIAIPVIIPRDGKRWLQVPIKKLLSLPDPISLLGTKKEIVSKNKSSIVVDSEELSRGVDVAFIAMHGPYGEDGTMQGMLELAGIKYTGSEVLASALGMDKVKFRQVLKGQRIPVPKYVVVEKVGKVPSLKKLGNYPYFVKPYNQGSSVGASIVRNKSQLFQALNLAFDYSDIALIDEYLVGTEITCSVIGNKEPEVLPLIEIIPVKGEFFDYESKYTESGAEEIVPARISKILTRKVQDLAVKVYKLIGAKGFARVDFILKGNKYPYVLEINTIPGLTPMSLLPKAANAAGINYGQLLDKIISYALE